MQHQAERRSAHPAKREEMETKQPVLDRRKFLAGIGLAGVTAAAAGTGLVGCAPQSGGAHPRPEGDTLFTCNLTAQLIIFFRMKIFTLACRARHAKEDALFSRQ